MWHRWLAWLFALPLLWLAITGALLGFAHELDRIVHVELMTTPWSQQPSMTEVEQRQQLQLAYPQWQLLNLSLAKNPVDTSVATMQDGNGVRWQVFLNPKLGHINGVRLVEDDWFERLSAAHRLAFLGVAAPWVVSLLMLGLLLIVISGLMHGYRQHRSVVSLHAWVAMMLVPMISVWMITGFGLVVHTEDTSITKGWLMPTELLALHTGSALAMPGRLLWVISAVGLIGLWLYALAKRVRTTL